MVPEGMTVVPAGAADDPVPALGVPAETTVVGMAAALAMTVAKRPHTAATSNSFEFIFWFLVYRTQVIDSVYNEVMICCADLLIIQFIYKGFNRSSYDAS